MNQKVMRYSQAEKYGKQYKDKDEQDRRFGIYVSNIQLIDQVNSKNLIYKLIDNKFVQLTNGEFKATYLTTSNFSNAKLDHHANKRVDWRKKCVLHPIKNQGQCGITQFFSFSNRKFDFPSQVVYIRNKISQL